jgi:hypothetical protein
MREGKSDDNYEFRSVKKEIQLFIIVASDAKQILGMNI